MKIIALPDVHGNRTNLDKIADDLATADVVLLVGDLTFGRTEQAEEIVAAIQQYNQQVLAIPGNMDTQAIVDYLEAQGINIHGTHRVIDGVTFVGAGGSLPFDGTFVFDEDGLMVLMDQAINGVDPDLPQVFVLHQPPANTTVDKVRGGDHVGSTSVRTFIERHQPLVCFTGHIHEAQGITSIGETQIINPGRLWRESAYAYAEIENGELTVLEIKRV